MEGQIRKVMTSTLLSESKKRNIELKDLRIKMTLSKDESSTKCFVMNKTNEVYVFKSHFYAILSHVRHPQPHKVEAINIIFISRF